MSQRATDFLVWRAGNSVDWECTHSDIAAELGITPRAVSLVCRRRGWKCQSAKDASNSSFLGRFGVDHLMAASSPMGAT